MKLQSAVAALARSAPPGVQTVPPANSEARDFFREAILPDVAREPFQSLCTIVASASFTLAQANAVDPMGTAGSSHAPTLEEIVIIFAPEHRHVIQLKYRILAPEAGEQLIREIDHLAFELDVVEPSPERRDLCLTLSAPPPPI